MWLEFERKPAGAASAPASECPLIFGGPSYFFAFS